MIRPVLAFAVLFLTAPAARTATLHVPGDYPTIQAAVDQTAVGDTVLVAPGTYSDCTHVDDTGTLSCVILPRRIVLRSSGGRDMTTIDAAGKGRGIFCLGGGVDATLEGFTLRGGSASWGAGVLVAYSGVGFTVSACRFVDNHADVDGGGIFLAESAIDPAAGSTIEESDFSSNSAGGSGAAIYFLVWARISDCRIVENGPSASAVGGTPAAMELERTLIAGNQGCGLCLADGWEGTLFATDCTIANNGGVSISSTFFHLVLTRCIVGGTIDCGDWGSSTFDFVDHFEGTYGGNCDLFWNQSNLNADPLFCDPVNGDYRLQSGSPCLPDNNPYGVLYGALGEGCGTVAVEPESWARIKARYRD